MDDDALDGHLDWHLPLAVHHLPTNPPGARHSSAAGRAAAPRSVAVERRMRPARRGPDVRRGGPQLGGESGAGRGRGDPGGQGSMP